MVVGFGGYPTIPALSAAWVLGLPRMIHEQNGVLGRVNRLFAARVDQIACGTWPTPLPEGVEGTYTGNPVRAAVRVAAAAAPYHFPGEGEDLSVLVIGGSQGARILSDVVPEAMAHLPEPLRPRLRVAHQARDEDRARAVDSYDKAGIGAEVEPFFTDIARRLTGAQLVISRSGASSVADIAAIGRPSLLVPFAAATADHQTANAAALVQAGAAVLLPEKQLDAAGLAQHMAAVLTDPARAEAMAAAARALGRPDATDRLVALVETLSRKARP